MMRAVIRRRANKSEDIPRQIGVDEKAIAKDHCYIAVSVQRLPYSSYYE